MYNKRIWLSKDESHFTSSLVCFQGEVKVDKKVEEASFIEIADCYHKIRLHVGDEYNYSDYVNKIDKIINELSNYRDYLKQNKLSPQMNAFWATK